LLHILTLDLLLKYTENQSYLLCA